MFAVVRVDSNLPLKSTVYVTSSFYQTHSRAICKSENLAWLNIHQAMF